jgi:hypothetical protein
MKRNGRHIRRRDFLSAAALASAGLFVPWKARAIGAPSAFAIARLQYDGDWNPRPNAARRLMAEVAKATSVETAELPVDLPADSPKIFEHPFLYVSGTGDFPSFSEKGRENLSRFLRFGGFMLVDGASGEPDGAFDRGFRKAITELLPGQPLAKLDEDHSVFRSFFLVSRIAGRVAERPYLEGVTMDDWTPVVYTPNDIGGALERDPFGNYRFDVVPGGEDQRSWATRLSVNLVLYALTVNYKKDQIHVEAILRRRRR